jgi:glycosyltransferase involved in cell wall biosynthesis
MTAAGDQNGLARFAILIVSPITVFADGASFSTMDLWARDINTQARLASICLVCPIDTTTPANAQPLDPVIHVISDSGLGDDELKRIIDKADIVQIPGNAGWRASRLSLRVLRIAKRMKKAVVLGVSSNRAKTAWLNSSNKLIGALRYLDVRSCQSWQAQRSDGVLVVGKGLRSLFTFLNRNIYVGTASWINVSDIRPHRENAQPDVLRICMASRLEKMKGVHVGLDAVKIASRQLKLHLTILGDGPEKASIERQVADLQMTPFTIMQQTVSYPEPFLSILNGMDLVLLTNLSDEQPRLMFDALSQGCIPVCPQTPAFRDLGLDARVFYQQGSAEDLASAILRLSDPGVRRELQQQMPLAAVRFTIETMHQRRSEWLSRLAGKSGARRASVAG